jgi:hypothetical protein
MDDKHEIIQAKLKTQQESIAPQDSRVEKFSLIGPMRDYIVIQMNVIGTCFSVHSHIAFTEENGRKLSETMLVTR